MESNENKSNENKPNINETANIEQNTVSHTNPIYFNQDILLDTSDLQLVDVNKIEEKVQHYINNYKSTEFNNYLKILTKIPKIFGKKSYIIEYLSDSISIFKVNKIKDKTKDKNRDRELIHKIQKPVLEELPNNDNTILNLNYLRNTLKNQYINYFSQDNVSLSDKSQFVKQKEEFIKELENYYICQNYYAVINNQNNQENDKHISVANYSIFMNEKTEYDNKLFLSHYRINSDIIDQINQLKSDNLEKYNLINEQIDIETNKELEETISNYLKKDDKTVNKQLQNIINQQNNIINYKIIKLPKLDNKLLEYL
jgi:hypothetical protein